MRSWTILPLLLLLPACWASSGSFYTPDPRGAAPFASGRYADPDHPERVVTMTRLPDGRYRLQQGAQAPQTSPVSFAPLAVPGRKVWIMQVPFALPSWRASVYELVEQRADGAIVIAELECGKTEAAARAAGASVTRDPNMNGGKPSCTFATRAQLERAAIAYARANPTLPASAAVRRVGG